MEELKIFLLKTYFGNTLWEYLYFFLIILAVAIVTKGTYFLFKTRARRLAKKTRSKLDDLIIDNIEEPIALLMVIGGSFFASKTLYFTDKVRLFISHIIFIVFLLAITWFVIRMLDVVIKGFLTPLASKTKSKLDDQLIPIVTNIVKVAIWIMVIIVLLSELGYDVFSLITGLGIGGIAIAIAAKETLGHMFGGFNIFVNKPFQIDDNILFKGYEGTIEEVGIRMTAMRSVDDTKIIIPNSEIANSLVENLSERRARRTLLFVRIDPETGSTDIEKAAEKIKKIVGGIEGVRNDVRADLFDFVDYSMTYRIVYWVTDLPAYFGLRHEANMAIVRALEETGVKLCRPIHPKKS